MFYADASSTDEDMQWDGDHTHFDGCVNDLEGPMQAIELTNLAAESSST